MFRNRFSRGVTAKRGWIRVCLNSRLDRSDRAFRAILPLFGLLPNVVVGAGYYLPNQDAFATAKGNAFVATADNASAVFYNPAGLTQLDSDQALIGAYSIMLGNRAEVAGKKYKAKSELQVAPHIFYAKPYSERLTFGFGLNSPFGLGSDWDRNTNFSPAVTETRLMFLSGTAAAGYKITDELSIGGSLSVNYADLTLEQGLGIPDSFMRFEGNDLALSGALSVRWQPVEKHAFGLLYSTGSKFNLDGRTISNFLPRDNSAGLNFMTPARIAGGYSYRPAPGWNIEANVEWLNWDSLDTLTLKSTSVGGAVPITFDWESTFVYEIGVSYTSPDGYIFAAGYDLNSNAQPDKNFTPGVSDADRHWFNAGIGRKWASSSWMLAYQFGYSNRVVDGAVNPLVDGKYKVRHHALVLSWQHSF